MKLPVVDWLHPGQCNRQNTGKLINKDRVQCISPWGVPSFSELFYTSQKIVLREAETNFVFFYEVTFGSWPD